MLNRVQIVGNLGAAPEIRNAQSGRRIANFRVASTERWNDRDGVQQERTEWIPVVVMNDHLVKIAEERATKGTLVFVEGQMQTRKWTDGQGIERYITEVILGTYNAKLIVFSGSQGDYWGPASDRSQSRGAARPAPARAGAWDERSADDLGSDNSF